MSKPKLMRDAFVESLYDAAKTDRNVFFLSADFGAAALDSFRKNLPDQFIHTGISEQNMVDVGAGLALSGKKVFLYAMAPFITARCYEQTKSVIASMNLPITLIAVGVGLGYDHATLTHFTPEDVACMKALNGIEVLSPCDHESAAQMARLSVEKPAFRYIRLERQPQTLLYKENDSSTLHEGFSVLSEGTDICLVACGYFTHKILKAKALLKEKGIDAGVVDLFRIKPLNRAGLMKVFNNYPAILSAEEQLLEGGFGSAIAELLTDHRSTIPLKRMGIQDGFEVVNGNRDYLHQLYNIDIPDIVHNAEQLIKNAR